MKYKLLISIFCSLIGFELNAQIPTIGLKAFFPFTNNSRDSSNYKTHGIVHNATLTTDRFGNPNSAYRFRRDSFSYIEFDAKNVQNDRYTYSLWANIEIIPNDGNMGFALNIGSTNGDQSLNIGNNFLNTYNGWLAGGYNTTSPNFALQENNQLTTNKWSHIVCVRDSNYAKLYIDCKLVDSIGSSSVKYPSYGTSSVKAIIGMRNDLSSPFNGKIDDVMIYDRALSFNEVKQLMDDQSTEIKKTPIKQLYNFSIYPNPCNGQFSLLLKNFNSDLNAINIEIINSYGQAMAFETDNQSNSLIQVRHQFSSGIYIVQMKDTSGAILGTQKLIVN